jgi:hypothetical protein
MEVLDYIDLPSIEPEHVAQAVNDYIAARQAMIGTLDVKVRVSICKTQETARAGRNERRDTLMQLIAVSGESCWKEGTYSFDFSKGMYLDGSAGMHFTPGEAVALYQKLVRKQDTEAWAAFYSNMKKRLGKDFLEGLV